MLLIRTQPALTSAFVFGCAHEWSSLWWSYADKNIQMPALILFWFSASDFFLHKPEVSDNNATMSEFSNKTLDKAVFLFCTPAWPTTIIGGLISGKIFSGMEAFWAAFSSATEWVVVMLCTDLWFELWNVSLHSIYIPSAVMAKACKTMLLDMTADTLVCRFFSMAWRLSNLPSKFDDECRLGLQLLQHTQLFRMRARYHHSCRYEESGWNLAWTTFFSLSKQ